MPQPLSRIAHHANVEIGNVGDDPLSHRPQIALLAMKSIAAWSNVESFMLRTFVELAGGQKADAAAVFLAMETSTAKSAAISALAERKLSAPNLALLRAIIKVVKSAQKERDKIAHWIWGTSAQLLDALLLADPRNLDLKREEIYVYREADFVAMISRFERIAGWGLSFRFIMRGHVANRDGQLYDELCQEPEISEILRRPARQG